MILIGSTQPLRPNLEAFEPRLEHPAVKADLERVGSTSRRVHADWVVTTEKDWVRLRDVPRPAIELWLLSVRLDMGIDRAALVEILARTLRRKAEERALP